MKTASRILGSAAFHAGYEVQDSPTYGAERRGAPVAAFTRIAREPVLERGAIERPQLVVISDDTLVDEPAAAPLSGCREDTLLLMNTERLIGKDFPSRTVAYDFTSKALDATGRIEGLSTALGAAASRLVGLPIEDCLSAVEDELAGTLLSAPALGRNLELAREVYSLGAAWPTLEWPVEIESDSAPVELAALTLESPRRGAPSIYVAANSPAKHTGSWRQFRPVLEDEKCNGCWLCFVWCPEAAIALDANDKPLVDYDVCKGCLLCAHECPTHAFRVEREARAEA